LNDRFDRRVGSRQPFGVGIRDAAHEAKHLELENIHDVV
jgi:hypothetical protein